MIALPEQIEAAKYPSEIGHWYDPRTGQQVELPPRTRKSTAIKLGYVPGVTSVKGIAAKGAGLEAYEGDRFIDCTVAEIQSFYDSSPWIPSPEEIRQQVWDLVGIKKEAIFGRGKELHGAIELYAQGKQFDDKWIDHISEADSQLTLLGIYLRKGSSEHSFATERYGGKIDWHNDKWLLDFKTKDNKSKIDTLYFDLSLQMAAYCEGLGLPRRRCANVFVGVDDASVRIYEWSTEELVQGWTEFSDLLDTWWGRTKRTWSTKTKW